jgi:hypothetical protein
MRALGAHDLPPHAWAAGAAFRHVRTIKHDFFAATGLYAASDGRKAIVKMNRAAPFFGLPLACIGRWLCGREVRCYEALADVPNIPPLLGRIGPTGFMHGFIEGRPLTRGMAVPDGFFDQLKALLKLLYDRGIAYVDTNKSENILLGDDGRPYLIDFQISFALHDFGRHALSRWWLARLHQADLYHLCKHKRRLRPDQLTAEEAALAQRRRPIIRLHRLLTRPYFILRRWVMKRLEKAGRIAPAGSN